MEHKIKDYLIELLKANKYKLEDATISFVEGTFDYVNKGRDTIGTETLSCELFFSSQSKKFDRVALIRLFKLKQIVINNTTILQKYKGFKMQELNASESFAIVMNIDFSYEIKET